jgi:glycosyltransferase involved in cell wall biosynthesis
MKIFHLITSLDNGGAENHLASLVKEQIKGNKVFVIYLKGNDYWKKKLENKGIKIIKIKMNSLINILNFFFVITKIKRLINNHKPDVVHAHLSSMELIGAIIKFFNKKKFKFIITKHLDSFFLEGSNGQNNLLQGIFIDKFILHNANKVICISNQIKKYFLKEINIPTNKLQIIYYGLNLNDLKNKKKINIKNIKNVKFNNHFVICCIARHVKQKSLDFLIKTFYEVQKSNFKSKLILVGNGPETTKLKELAYQFHISKKIVWINYIENVLQILKISDVFVLPSRYEGFGLVLLEAMFAKKPIIATNVSAIPEVIKDNWNGLLIKHGDINDFKRNLLKIKANKINKKLIDNSQKTLKTKFNFKKMIIKTSRIYDQAVK